MDRPYTASDERNLQGIPPWAFVRDGSEEAQPGYVEPRREPFVLPVLYGLLYNHLRGELVSDGPGMDDPF